MVGEEIGGTAPGGEEAEVSGLGVIGWWAGWWLAWLFHVATLYVVGLCAGFVAICLAYVAGIDVVGKTLAKAGKARRLRLPSAPAAVLRLARLGASSAFSSSTRTREKMEPIAGEQSKGQSAAQPPLNRFELALFAKERLGCLLTVGYRPGSNIDEEEKEVSNSGEDPPSILPALEDSLEEAEEEEQHLPTTTAAVATSHLLETSQHMTEANLLARRRSSVKLAEREYLVVVHVVRAVDLVASDKNGKSSPYVKLRLGSQVVKTKHIPNELNPVWDATFEMKTRSPKSEQLTLQVYDYEKVGRPDRLGQAVYDLRNLKEGEEKEATLELTGLAQTYKSQVPATGSISLKFLLLPWNRVQYDKRQKHPLPSTAPPLSELPLNSSLASTPPSPYASGSLPSKKLSAKKLKKMKKLEDKLQKRKEEEVPSGSDISLASGGIPNTVATATALASSANKRTSVVGLEKDLVGIDDIMEEDTTDVGVSEEDVIAASDTDQINDMSLKEGALHIRTLTKVQWKERWFILNGNGRLTFYSSKKRKHPLGMVDLKGCFVEPFNAQDEETDGESNRKSRRKASENTALQFVIRHPTRPVFLTRTDKGVPLKSSKDFEDCKRFILRAQTPNEMMEWMNFTASIIESLETRQRLFSIPPDVPTYSVPYINIALQRHFEDMRTSPIFKNEIMRKLGAILAAVNRPSALGPLIMEDLDFGDPLVDVFDNVRVANTDTPNEMLAEVDIHYNGGLSLRVSTHLTKLNMRIPVVVEVKINAIAGRLSIYAPPEIQEQFFACFAKLPELAIDVTLYVSGKRLPVTSLPRLRNFILNAVKNALRMRLVYPGRIKFHIPFPGRKINVKVINARMMNPLVAPSTTALAPSSTVAPLQSGTASTQAELSQTAAAASSPTTASNSAGPTANVPVPTQPLILEAADAAAKKFLNNRFFTEVLNEKKLDVIDEIFLPNCSVHGTDLCEQDQMGLQAIYDWVNMMHSSFPDLNFYTQDLWVEDYNVYHQWKARGTNQGELWGYPATNEEMIFYGLTISTVKFGNQKIVEQWHYWSLGSLLRRELKEREFDRALVEYMSSSTMSSSAQD